MSWVSWAMVSLTWPWPGARGVPGGVWPAACPAALGLATPWLVTVVTGLAADIAVETGWPWMICVTTCCPPWPGGKQRDRIRNGHTATVDSGSLVQGWVIIAEKKQHFYSWVSSCWLQNDTTLLEHKRRAENCLSNSSGLLDWGSDHCHTWTDLTATTKNLKDIYSNKWLKYSTHFLERVLAHFHVNGFFNQLTRTHIRHLIFSPFLTSNRQD